MPEETRMRRQPKQARSQQRVDHLLNVAALVFEEIDARSFRRRLNPETRNLDVP